MPPLSLSLVTPSFQQAAYLRVCIESVLGQAYPNLEYRVLDGGSTDGSRQILESYGERFFWRSQPDAGQTAAINEGLRQARGEVVGFLNSDDLLLPGALDAVAAAFAEHPEAEVVYGRAVVVDGQGAVLREYPTYPYDPDLLRDHCFICQPAAFWRRRLHEQHGYLDTQFDCTMDYEFWIRLASRGVRFHFLDRPLAASRAHADTKSQRQRGRIFREIRRLQCKHLGYCSRNWWEQHLRYLRDETSGLWPRLLPGRRDQRLYRLAWWPYILWRRRLGGPLFYRPGHFRA